jgi:glutamate racemase
MSAAGPGAGRRAGLLHTVPALAGTFQASVEKALPGIRLVHVADPWLLSTAIEAGVTEEVKRTVAAHIRYLADCGAEAVLVTCSSIGEAVEAAASSVDVPVLRVDAPMAAEAVDVAAAAARSRRRNGRIAVLATLAATLAPTGRLIQRAAESRAGGAGVEVDTSVVEGAVAAREAGDSGRHDALIAEAVALAAGRADVVVLAQASMAQAIAGSTQPVPVLTSPGGGVAALVRALG